MLTDTVTNRKLNLKDGLFWTIAILVILTNMLFSLASVFEIYQISFTDIEKEYHWGAEPFPWYYENKMTYLTYTGSWTILFLTTLFFQVYFALKDNKTKELYSGLLFILLFATMLIVNGPID
ncbi:hypothetical protein DQ356_10595 [Chryseobacterium lacus]|uniref:Uncharacterized protein n=1 Tax=Chryseobacterium lacus TaxID=2058346 RepID=A0A368MVY6_9FLAO|nr:hypothetical protein DQ356_10595 [Chryseobacterium lacus]